VITIIGVIIWIILMIYFAGGAWCGLCRRRRTLTEDDFQKDVTCATHPADEDAVLVSLDIALMDGLGAPARNPDENHLS